jgi:hypothetical protein
MQVEAGAYERSKEAVENVMNKEMQEKVGCTVCEVGMRGVD